MKQLGRPTHVAAGYLLLVAGLTVLYWIDFFTGGGVHVRDDAVYQAFEKAFPLADAWMAACSLIGAIGLWRRRPWGLLFGLLAGAPLLIAFLWRRRHELLAPDHAHPAAGTRRPPGPPATRPPRR